MIDLKDSNKIFTNILFILLLVIKLSVVSYFPLRQKYNQANSPAASISVYTLSDMSNGFIIEISDANNLASAEMENFPITRLHNYQMPELYIMIYP